jgi:lipopolysaccharide cholinephosphotransferase
MVKMLEFLDKFCKDNHINYWIDSGTLLGAVRHGGFIPWDDDTDICMLRKDYLKFIKIFGDKKHGNFVLQTHQTDKGYFRFWSVVRDLKTEYVHSDDMPCEQMLKYRGVQIDVFPVIDRFTKLSINLSKKISWRVNHYYISEAYTKKHLFTRLYFFLGSKIVFPLLHLLFRKKQENIICDYGVGFYQEKRCISHIFPLSRIKFENIELNCPNNPKAYCELLYGNDFMEMPKNNLIYDHNTTVLFH